MRLTHLKLAGFKSFVDPTTLHIHGQRVGVVGPNGCGKSNVMESVRWVLGESSAKEMRADAMDAVIFNGSSNRKAISRASVELTFDNSLGSANGEWSKYAEISVKRVIERDKGSSYFINNTAVRRRDVADLFLGTGLGGRAYAIIGQNTISRIVEAKPDEMRVFLEEAAGISKYKERRRETELRLSDTRENLIRVQDILQEMDKLIIRLEAQSVVTLQYHELQNNLKLSEGRLWLIKKREAGAIWEKTKSQVEKLVIELEAQTASLRHIEAVVEGLRQQYHLATEGLQSAQANYYESNSEVSNLEQQVKHTAEARERLLAQLNQIDSQTEKLNAQKLNLEENLGLLKFQQQSTGNHEIEANNALKELRNKLPEIERAFQSAMHIHTQAQHKFSETEQVIRLESSHIEHIEKNILELGHRITKLIDNQKNLKLPDMNVIESIKDEYLKHEQLIADFEIRTQLLREQESNCQKKQVEMRETLSLCEKKFNQNEAQINSLKKLQASISNENQLESWLNTHKIISKNRLWQKFKIELNWETAFEAVLGSRLNAILQTFKIHSIPLARPPAKLVLADTGSAITSASKHDSLTPLITLLTDYDPEVFAVLNDWLTGVYLIEDETDIQDAREKLDPGEMLVNKQGDIYTRKSITLYSSVDSNLHGVIERQRELEALIGIHPELQNNVSIAQDELRQSETQLANIRHEQQEQSQLNRTHIQSQHQRNLEIQRLEQQQKHVIELQKNLQAEMEGVAQQRDALNLALKEKIKSLDLIKSSLEGLYQEKQNAQSNRTACEIDLNQARVAIQKSERDAQEKSFNNKLIINKIFDIEEKLKSMSEELHSLFLRRKECEALLQASKMENLKENLEIAINNKRHRELILANSRDAMALAEQSLQNEERNRMQTEQSLYPLRDKLEQSRLNEQQARIYFEQCHEKLIQTGLNETELSHQLTSNAKALDFENKINQLNAEIESLGAVNLAALQELESERQRKEYLDNQAKDLNEAVNTLEDAIKRIDKETKVRLQQTFDEANKYFGELFITLFGGGQARLELLGDDILDTGMQVFAQPPGKKNSTIHLLSGGEKALTALALVFALFKLNPAPFCLMDEVDAPLDDSNTERFCAMVKKMSERTQFLFVSHNKITMEMAQQLIGVTMQESGVSRIVEVDMEAALQMKDEIEIGV